MQDADIRALRADCDLANKFWGRTFSVISAMTYREKGEEAVKRLWLMMLGQHQKSHFLEGLRRLGIRDDEPPAIRAAKYHYLTNEIGGLKMEYVEESPRKVWIRYLAPMWLYAGVAMIAMPSSHRRASATGWHSRNGAFIGCPRLQYVSTKFIMEGEAYDEGYFIEHDRDLLPGEEWRFEPVTHTPEFDPSKAPRLDLELWPEARRMKARRKWMREYLRTTIDCLFQMFGQQTTYFLMSQVMRAVAIQFTHELKCDTGVEGSDASAVAAFLYRLNCACGQDIELTESKGVYRLVLRTHLPFVTDVSDGLRVAAFEFPLMVTRYLNGYVSVVRVPDGQREIWEIRDTGRWLW